eukprot:m.304537 g.304537  ORF g.304537 m.304537 type:complete len:331 (+) comp17002_c0_seq1:129-1121(+)
MAVVGLHLQQIAALTFVVLLGIFVLHTGLQRVHAGHPTSGFLGSHWTREGQTLEAREVLSSPHLRVESHTVRTPAGEVVHGWFWIDIPDQIHVLAEDASGRFLVFQQTRYGLPGETLAVCDGVLRRDEAPLVAAQRILAEQTHRRTRDWVFLGTFRTDSTRGAGFVSSFLARNTRVDPTLAKVPKVFLQGNEASSIPVSLTRAELAHELLAGHFQDVKWSNTVSLALLSTGLPNCRLPQSEDGASVLQPHRDTPGNAGGDHGADTGQGGEVAAKALHDEAMALPDSAPNNVGGGTGGALQDADQLADNVKDSNGDAREGGAGADIPNAAL